MISSRGEVIGIYTRSDYYSFAVPSNRLKALLTQSGPLEPLAQWHQRDHIRAYAYHHEGEGRFNAGDYVKAIVSFDNAISQNPKHIRAYFWRGRAKYGLGKSKADQGNITEAQQLYQVAIGDYTQAIQLFPKYPMAYNNRGWVKYLIGRIKAKQGNVGEARRLYQAAIDDYTHAININPQHVLAHYNRGNAKKALGQHEAAEKDFEKAKELESKK